VGSAIFPKERGRLKREGERPPVVGMLERAAKERSFATSISWGGATKLALTRRMAKEQEEK